MESPALLASFVRLLLIANLHFNLDVIMFRSFYQMLQKLGRMFQIVLARRGQF
jgi:hypothetical protein